jgi:hypothetical protein
MSQYREAIASVKPEDKIECFNVWRFFSTKDADQQSMGEYLSDPASNTKSNIDSHSTSWNSRAVPGQTSTAILFITAWRELRQSAR